MRVVSLVPAATEILLALGARAALVARTDVERDGALAGLPSVGQVLTPNLEALASARPELVIAWSGADLTAVTRVVQRGGGRVEPISIDRLADVEPAIRRIGAWVARAARADTLASEFSGTLRAARDLVARTAGPIVPGAASPVRVPLRVLWVVWADPIVVAGPGTFLADVIEVAGGVNATDGAAAPWPRLGPESLLAARPDVLVWPEGEGVFPATDLPARAPWSLLPAVGAGRVTVVDPDLVHVPGPRIAAVALDLARRLAEMGQP